MSLIPPSVSHHRLDQYRYVMIVTFITPYGMTAWLLSNTKTVLNYKIRNGIPLIFAAIYGLEPAGEMVMMIDVVRISRLNDYR